MKSTGNSSAMSKFKNECNSILKPWYKDNNTRSVSNSGHYNQQKMYNNPDDIYSTFSKKTYQSYQTL